MKSNSDDQADGKAIRNNIILNLPKLVADIAVSKSAGPSLSVIAGNVYRFSNNIHTWVCYLFSVLQQTYMNKNCIQIHMLLCYELSKQFQTDFHRLLF